MKFEDDRLTEWSEEQRKSNHVIVAATDSFLSGWGGVKVSYCGWACKPEQIDDVYRWVKSRREMKRVRVVLPTWRPRGSYHDHVHIYVIDDGHPALH